MYPLMVELRGMSMSGEELMEGGHPLALSVLSITLTKPSSLRLTLAVWGLWRGSVVLVGLVLLPGVMLHGSLRLLSGIGTLLRFSSTMRD